MVYYLNILNKKLYILFFLCENKRMKEFTYQINIRIKNSKPVPMQNLSQFFAALEDEYSSGLGKTFNLQFPDAETKLAISQVNSGSQIYTIVALVAADCLFPLYNEQILVSFYDYIMTILNDFNEKWQLEKYNKRNCKNVKDVTELFKNDFNLELEFDIKNTNEEIKKNKISHATGKTIYDNAVQQLAFLDETKRDTFNDKLLYFHQTQNTPKSTGDRVIIKDFDERPKKIEFASSMLKQSVIGTKDNFYNNLYRASGYINYKGTKIQSYTVTKINVVRNENE